MESQKDGYLILSDGTVYKGKLFGAQSSAIGEVVFTTSMTGYQETLSDPSYYGQIVVQTFPLIGNYGVNERYMESEKVWPKGYVVNECCKNPSNFRSEGDLDKWLKENNVTALEGVNTRAITKKIRESGVCNGYITDSLDNKEEILKKLSEYKIENAIESVSGEYKKIITDPKILKIGRKADEHSGKDLNIALINYGAKDNIIRCLTKRGCNVDVLYYKADAKLISEFNPDGIMLSNGPGNPADNIELIDNLKEISKLGIPIFGICLGHQLLALAKGAKTRKLKYGHRGSNQPVVDIKTKRTLITTQNHGYEVLADSLKKSVGYESFINPNDNSCEGIIYNDCNAFTVQFHPESCGGPQDAEYMFDEFIERVKKYKMGEK